jgi:class 3 adenylate cyclase
VIAGQATSALRTPSPATPPSNAATASAERRQLTVMFCDLVGSTRLSARLDPEEMRDLIAVYRKCVTDAVARFDGFIARYLGDGVLVYFGYPQAHEDDAERAVRAGLAAVGAVDALDAPAGLQLRAHVGIATGLVVVGERIEAGGHQERDAIGETPNLAARLEALAAPGEVVIAASTHRLVGRINFDERRHLGWLSASRSTDLEGRSRYPGGGDRPKSEEQPHAKQIALPGCDRMRYLFDVFASAFIARNKVEISRRCAMASAV